MGLACPRAVAAIARMNIPANIVRPNRKQALKTETDEPLAVCMKDPPPISRSNLISLTSTETKPFAMPVGFQPSHLNHKVSCMTRSP